MFFFVPLREIRKCCGYPRDEVLVGKNKLIGCVHPDNNNVYCGGDGCPIYNGVDDYLEKEREIAKEQGGNK